MITWKNIVSYTLHGNPKPDRRIEKSDIEWKEILTEEQYKITRKKGTEKPFSGEACEIFEAGIYACICCDTLLFDSNVKYDSKSGWPSFSQPIKSNAIKYIRDESFGIRVEVQCNTCDSHLGHVFPDGPEPSGLRFCINSISIKLI